jgi:DNA-binding NarL/FixJ family response regulator
VHRGEAIFSPAVAARPFPDLTERERDILGQLMRGRSNVEVAERLHLTQKTVRNYESSILAKLRVRDRAQAIVKARDAGFPPS